ncbi:MAG: thioredoxin family protein [Akkermansia sp.]|nr:thioredoxin family protein [Akkermansia sp.]
MKISTILLTFGALASSAWALPQATSVESAMPLAKEQGRDIMLEFTGKEWCPPCIHLRTKIMETAEFEQAVGDKYVLVEVIFPRLPSAVAAIPEEQRNANEKLLTHHRIETGLPTVLLLDAEGYPYAQVAGARRTTADYLKALDEAASVRTKRDAAFARAEGLQGLERAAALAEGLNAIPENCRDKYPEQVKEINALDPENTLGYAGVLTRYANYQKQDAELKAIVDSMRGTPDAANLARSESVLKEFLQRKDLEPEIAQLAWRTLGDTYAFQRRYRDVYEAYKKAYDCAPKSRIAPRLEKAIQHYEKNILPAVERGELK